MRGLGYGDGITDIDETLRKCAQLRQVQGYRGPDTRGARAQTIGELRE